MTGSFVKIISYGLIGESEDGSSYRHVTFEEIGSSRKADYIVNQKQRPILWKDVEQLEKGKTILPYNGQITNFKGLELVVLGDESLEDAFENQKWKLAKHKRINLKEADRMRMETKGYCTDQTYKNAMEYSWRTIAHNAKKIKFRNYSGQGTFSWSMWHEIENK
jgi:hypothetical protein